jgi:hypothetical protein
MIDTVQLLVSLFGRLIFAASMFCAIYAAYDLYSNWDAQKSAPQQAALAGYVLGCAIIPYCFARAFSGAFGKRA